MEGATWGVIETFSAVTEAVRARAQAFQDQRTDHELWLEQLQGFDPSGFHSKGETEGELKTSIGDFVTLGLDEPPEEISILVPPRIHPISVDEWPSFFDEAGRLIQEVLFRERVFYGGINPALRSEAWPFLLNFFETDSTAEERDIFRAKKREEYVIYKSQWQSITADQEARFAKFRDRKHRIAKDVVRTDRHLEYFKEPDSDALKKLSDILITYSFYNFDLGYVQGMNDLLAPILFVMGDEADAFWCFKSLMDSMEVNFLKDQKGMYSKLRRLGEIIQVLDPRFYKYLELQDCLNMFFCFRWLLINFKRELNFDDIQGLWEALWSNHVAMDLQIYIATALILKHRTQIMEARMGFDDILRFINDLSGHLDYTELLMEGERTYLKYCYVLEREAQRTEQAALTRSESTKQDRAATADSEELFIEIQRPGEDKGNEPTAAKNEGSTSKDAPKPEHPTASED